MHLASRSYLNLSLRLLPFALLGTICIFQLFSLWTIYRAGDFGFFDLGLINDWMTNALRGSPFLVTNTQFSHSTYNFTPSLLLFAPLWLWDNQFILVIVTLLTFYAGIFLILCEAQRILSPQLNPAWLCLLMLALTICISENRFTRYVLMYPHFETIFMLPAGVLFLFINRTGKMFRILSVPVVLFACGLRQDAGFYLFTFIIATALAIPGSLKSIWQRVWLPLLITGASAIAAAYGATPALARDASGLRFWKYMGNTPPDVATYIISHPKEIYAAIQISAFADLNKAFGWLPLLTPSGWLANLAAWPMYLARPDEFMAKRLLLLYNSAMIIPGMLIATIGAIRYGFLFAGRISLTMPRQFKILPHVFSIFVSIFLIKPTAQYRPWLSLFRADGDLFNSAQIPIRNIRRTCSIDSVASDHYGITLTPNSLLRYTLPNVHKSDIVLVTDRIQYAPEAPDPLVLRNSLKGYRIYTKTDRFTLWVRNDLDCK
ncbi:MAG: hypothetical protein K8S54_14280 [Spirochaetia bacterium]|nr:hypothetical protein [Spirochaetia bacterium]